MNKYLTKLAQTFPVYQDHEFDLAYKDADNPTRERLERYFKHKDEDSYHRAVEDFRHDLDSYDRHDPHSTLPRLPSRYDFDSRRELEDEHINVTSLSGKEIQGPNKVGLGLGYGAGVAGLASSVITKNPIGAVLGTAALVGTGVYHLATNESGQMNRYINRVNQLHAKKEEALRKSQELDGL